MFAKLPAVGADPILGLSVAYRADPNPDKVDLGVGVYKNEHGQTTILKSVSLAEKYLLENEITKTYQGMAGDEDYNRLIGQLLFAHSEQLDNGRLNVCQTPGGTGALRVAAEFIKRCNPQAKIWLSKPSWLNHDAIFQAAGLQLSYYGYYDTINKCLDFPAMMLDLESAGQGDVVIIHASCHNPCGMDLSNDQWQQLTDLAKEKGFMPLIDAAYQGFDKGLDEDVFGLRLMAEQLPELVVCSSCSKNFGIYRERTGTISVLAKDASRADVCLATIKSVAREIYSMPPAHGGAIVRTILSSDELSGIWREELAEMRGRISELRHSIVTNFQQVGIDQDFSFIQRQSGMFSFLGINEQQVTRLREEYSIYMMGSSRINVAGISHANINYFSKAVMSVL